MSKKRVIFQSKGVTVRGSRRVKKKQHANRTANRHLRQLRSELIATRRKKRGLAVPVVDWSSE